VASPVGVWCLTEGQTPQFLALRPNILYSTYIMCTVPILRLLPQYEEVKEDDDVRGFSPQNLMLYNKQTQATTIKHTAISPNLKSRYDYDKLNNKIYEYQ